MKNGFGGIETSDWILLSCAVLPTSLTRSQKAWSISVPLVKRWNTEFWCLAASLNRSSLRQVGSPPVLICTILLSQLIGGLLPVAAEKLHVDPAVMYVVQIIAGVFIAGGVAVGVYWRKIKKLFSKDKTSVKKHESTEQERNAAAAAAEEFNEDK